jgi:uncharacterized protein YuzE
MLWARFKAMKLSYLEETDTLYIEFREADTVDTKDLDKATILDFDGDGQIISITLDHARANNGVQIMGSDPII